MITKKDFILLNKEVLQSIDQAFKFIKDKCKDHDYLLYLADGELREEFKSNHSKLNPYGIDSKVDKYKDESRLAFFVDFMRNFYSFNENKIKTVDDDSKITIELMVYTHIWESKTFLKQLYRLASLANGNTYEWDVKVPDTSKHEFIREKIRDVFKLKKLRIGKTISNGYLSSLRNAFAHSEYYLDNKYKRIHLDTYKGASWDISSISYNDWTKRFLYTALLSYHFLNLKYEKRKSLISDFGKDEFLIVQPLTPTKDRVVTIYYYEEQDMFSYHRR